MILTIGSVNIDHVYRVETLPSPGQTLSDRGYARGLGGKGANQSLAAALAGAEVRHCGAVGSEGAWCRAELARAGVDVGDLAEVDAATGHAVILVDGRGENVIVIHPGANRALTPDLIDRAIGRAAPGDWVLLQNETNLVVEAAEQAKVRGLKVAYAAAPFDPGAAARMLGLADLLAVNEGEATQLAWHLGIAVETLPVPGVLITLGGRGALWRAGGEEIRMPAFVVDAVDTTGAGDTILGYFLAGLDGGRRAEDALRRASAAAAIQVTRAGAAAAIPRAAEVDAFLAGRATEGRE